MSIELKIKSKHLATEPAIIRQAEQHLKQQIRSNWAKEGKGKDQRAALITHLNSLVLHRKSAVRNEARATFLARAFLAGAVYAECENKRLDEQLFRNYIVPRIVNMVEKYGHKRTSHDEIMKWAELPKKQSSNSRRPTAGLAGLTQAA